MDKLYIEFYIIVIFPLHFEEIISLSSGVYCGWLEIWIKSRCYVFIINLTFLLTLCPGALLLFWNTSVGSYLSCILCFFQLNTSRLNKFGRLPFWVIIFWKLPVSVSLLFVPFSSPVPLQRMLKLVLLFSCLLFNGSSSLCFFICVLYFVWFIPTFNYYPIFQFIQFLFSCIWSAIYHVQ